MTLQRPWARRAGCRGQSAIEFILVAPLFLLVVFFTLQTALIYQAQAVLDLAAFYGARECVTNSSKSAGGRAAVFFCGSIKDEIQSKDGTNPCINVKYSEGAGTYGDMFTCTVSVNYKLLPIPLIRDVFGISGNGDGTIPLEGKAIYLYANQPFD